MDCFHCIFKSTEKLAHLIQCSNWFHDFSISCSICSKSTKSMKPNGNISTGFAKVLLFVKNFYFKQKLSFLINTIFGYVSQTSGVIACGTRMLKKYFSNWKKYFLVWHFIENQVFTISALFLCSGVCSLFKPMKLVCQ